VVASDRAGAVALFNVSGPPVDTIAFSTLSSHGDRFSPPRELPDRRTVNSPILAANLAGTFVMLWADSRRVVNAPYSLHAAEGTASGVQRAQTIVPAAHTFAVDSEVAGIDRNGNAIAIWDDFGDDGYTYGVFETALHP
jgi:hypothetical protein